MTGYLLDTNVLSEFSRERPEVSVVEWLKAQRVASLFISVVTIGEIRKGLVTMPSGRKRTDLERWFHTELLPWFDGRILPITQQIADRWGALDGHCQLKGTPLNMADGLIAATALDHGLTLVTRNARDFVRLGGIIFNPWQP